MTGRRGSSEYPGASRWNSVFADIKSSTSTVECFKYGCMIFDDTDGILCLLNDNASQEKDSMQCNDKEHLR